MLQLEQLERIALADRAAGRVDEEGHAVSPETYRSSFLGWLYQDPDQTEDAAVRRLMRELEVA